MPDTDAAHGYRVAAQPAYLRAVNGLGELLSLAGLRLPELDADQLMGRAVRRTGLEDFGEDAWLPALRQLVGALHETAELSQIGRIVAYMNLLDHLSVRLRLIEQRRLRPDIGARPVARPLFILGLPRTGTTILFELLAQDPAFRSPASWEVSRPFPPPVAANYDDDPRIRSVERLLSVMERLAPGFRVIHALGARLPQECVYLMASQFISEQFGYMYNVPDYRRWALAQDMSATYRWHAHFLQHLQADFRAERWLLKSPAHLGYLDCLIGQYPDAAIVWTHRRPLDAVASFSSLTTTLRSAFSDRIDPIATGAFEMQHYGQIVEAGMSARERMDAGRIFDIGFTELCADPIAVIRSLYRHFGWELQASAEASMQRYLRTHPRNRHGVHDYHARDFGLTEDHEAQHFSTYLERFSGLWA